MYTSTQIYLYSYCTVRKIRESTEVRSIDDSGIYVL